MSIFRLLYKSYKAIKLFSRLIYWTDKRSTAFKSLINIHDNKCSREYLLVQSRQWKHLKKVRNMFKVNNKDSRINMIAEHISPLSLVFLLLTLNRQMFSGIPQETEDRCSPVL